MFATAAPLSEPQVLVTTVIVTAAVILPFVFCVAGGLGYFQSKTVTKS